MAILSGRAVASEVKAGAIEITPFDEAQLNPVSYDLRLGDQVAVYDDWTHAYPRDPVCLEDGRHFMRKDAVMDIKQEPKTSHFKISESLGWVLKPGIAYLMHTLERIHTDKYVPVLDGKSSIGRLFLKVHETAGFGDPGYEGQYTLEVTVQSGLRVYPGMRICQIRFHEVSGEVVNYKKLGRYNGDLATGPVPSQAWRMFAK